MNFVYNDPKMTRKTKCPKCDEIFPDIQIQDDEDLTEIESLRLSKFGGDSVDQLKRHIKQTAKY